MMSLFFNYANNNAITFCLLKSRVYFFTVWNPSLIRSNVILLHIVAAMPLEEIRRISFWFKWVSVGTFLSLRVLLEVITFTNYTSQLSPSAANEVTFIWTWHPV